MKIAERLARLETRDVPSSRVHRIVIYDASTGAPLPGYEPKLDARVSIWIPNNRWDDTQRHGEWTAHGDDPRCD